MNVLTYEQSFIAGTEISGGKGWNLSRLERYGFNVPEGLVISSEVYLSFMDKIKEKINSLKSNPDKQKEILEDIQKTILEIDFSENFKTELSEIYNKTLKDKILAIRSSATLEDGSEFSFAGIHSSFLNISGFDNVIENIKNCYASLWTAQAFAYRENMKITHENVKCAVVICEMVKNIKYAGVIFTSDPVSGRRDLLKISAVEGLADKLVSGHVNPDEITVKKNFMDYEISRLSEANKTLDNKQITLLCNIAQRILWDLGEGQLEQDIEWVHDGEKFWIVQSRPITNLQYPTLEALKNMPVIWSNGNFKDAIPGIQSNLGWSGLQKVIRYIMYIPVEKSGINVPQGMEILRRFQGRMYFDLGFMQYLYNEGYNLTPTETNKLIGGHQPEIPTNKLNLLQKINANLNSQKMLKAGKENEKYIYDEIKAIEGQYKFYKSLDYSKLNEKDIARYVNDIELILEKFSPMFHLANSSSGTSLTLLQMLMSKFAPEDAMEISTGLVSGSGYVTSAEQGYGIYELAKIVFYDNEALKYFTDKNFEVSEWKKLSPDSKFIKGLNNFLEKFGHRAVYEGEIANPRWNEDPSFIINQVKLITDSGDTSDPRDIAKKTRKRVEEKLSKYNKLLGFIAKKLAEGARKGASLREKAKSTMALTQEPTRMLVLRLGELMVEKNLIEDKNDILNLSKTDISMYLSGEWDGKGAKNLINDIKVRDKKWSLEKPADVIITDKSGNYLPVEKLADFNIESNYTKTKIKKGNIISGVGVSSGIVTAKVRIVNHPYEGDKLQKGEILVAPSTDPGWTPLFLKASGIIMEVGGNLSHGAIVSREYGIPAVVNIPGILEILKDGQEVTINGNKGEIIINKLTGII